MTNRSPYVKDGIHRYVVEGLRGAVNPEHRGTKVAARYQMTIKPGGSEVVRLRLCAAAPASSAGVNGNPMAQFGSSFESILQSRRADADEFYATVIPRSMTVDESNVMRQALAGMFWSKQFYLYDVDKWLRS